MSRPPHRVVVTGLGLVSSLALDREGTWSAMLEGRDGLGPLTRLALPLEPAQIAGQVAMDPDRHSCTWDGKPVTLTVTEFLILQSLAQRPGIVKSRDALMDAAYDDQVYVDDRTIDSHIKRLRKKFNAVDVEFDAIETLYGVGYRFKEQ